MKKGTKHSLETRLKISNKVNNYLLNNPNRKCQKTSEETKKKQSEARKRYLLNNPDKAAWHKIHPNTSIPCEHFRSLLISNNIQFVKEHQPLLHKGRFFSIDVAFPDKMVGIEINGRQHYDAEGNLLPYYQNRHDLITQEGWILYEIPYHIAFNDKYMLDLVNNILNSPSQVFFDYINIKPKQNKKLEYVCFKYKNKTDGHPTLHKYPSLEIMQQTAPNHSLRELSIMWNIPSKALWSYLNSKNIRTKGRVKKIKVKSEHPRIHTRKVERPSREKLIDLINNYPMTVVGKMFGITDNSVRRWCEYYKIILIKPKQGYWTKLKFNKINKLILAK